MSEATFKLGPLPGEETVRNQINNSALWIVLLTDYQVATNRTLFYLETKIARHYKNFYGENVTMKYLSIVWAANDMMAKQPDGLAHHIVGIANHELKVAVNCALGK